MLDQEILGRNGLQKISNHVRGSPGLLCGGRFPVIHDMVLCALIEVFHKPLFTTAQGHCAFY